MEERQPIFNIPGIVLTFLVLLVAVHVGLLLVDDLHRDWLTLALAFIPIRYDGGSDLLPGGRLAALTSFVTYALLHGDAAHLGFNAAWLLAFGSIMARRLGNLRFLAFLTASTIASAAFFLLFNWGLAAPVVGISGGLAGLMGGVMRFLFVAMDERDGPALRQNPAAIAALPLGAALTDRRVLGASAAFIAVNLLASIGFGSPGASGPIAWEAHIGGYMFGLLTFGLFDAPHTNSPAFAED